MKEVYVTRNQFPLSLSYAITQHKAQGLSLKNAVIDIGDTILNPGQSYVALSRVTKLQGLHLINFNPSKIMVDAKAMNEYNRLRTKYRSDLPLIVTSDSPAINIKHKCSAKPSK